MSAGFTIFMVLAMVLTLGVLFAGILTMGRGDEAGRMKSNKLMRWRVVLQGVAILCFLLAILFR